MSRRTLIFLIVVAVIVLLVFAYPKIKEKIDEQQQLLKQKAKALDAQDVKKEQTCNACWEDTINNKWTSFGSIKYGPSARGDMFRIGSAIDFWEDVRLQDKGWYMYELGVADKNLNSSAKELIAGKNVAQYFNGSANPIQTHLKHMYDTVHLPAYKDKLRGMRQAGTLPDTGNCKC